MEAILRQIINRCHVGDSFFSVIRDAVSRLKDGRKTFLAMPAKHRRRFLDICVKTHRANWELYRDVMGGKS